MVSIVLLEKVQHQSYESFLINYIFNLLTFSSRYRRSFRCPKQANAKQDSITTPEMSMNRPHQCPTFAVVQLPPNPFSDLTFPSIYPS